MTNYELNTLIICAFRYALGRMSYITGTITDLLIKEKDSIHKDAKQLICKEIRYALEHDEAGMDCDRIRWRGLLEVLEK